MWFLKPFHLKNRIGEQALTLHEPLVVLFIKLKEQIQFHARFTQNVTEERHEVSVRVVFTLHYSGVKYKTDTTTLGWQHIC